MFTVYLVTNSINNKQYVGVTSQKLEKRIKGHRNDSERKNGVFQLAIRKYGFSVFNFEVLKVTKIKEDVFELEKFYIKKLETKIPHGYNMTDGGEGTFGRKLTKEHINKIRDTRSKWSKEKQQEIKEKQSKSLKETFSQITKEKREGWNKKISDGRKRYFKNRTDEEADIINDKIKNTLRRNSKYSKACVVNGVNFVSYSEAGRYFGVSSDTIRRRIKSYKFLEYKDE